MGSEREEVAFPVSPLHLTWEPGYKASACAAAKVLNLPHRALCPDMRGPTLHFGPTTTDMSVASRLGEEGYLLCVEEQAGELVMQCLGRSPRGAFYALRCLRAAWEGEASLSLPLGVTVEEPAFAHRGIAEAAPLGWSWEIRGQLLLFAGRHQFDHYLYAPDDDPYRAARWREPYPPQEAQALSHFLSQARELFVSIIYGLQPELDPTSESDLRTLEEKCHWLVEAGVEGIALLCDAGKASGDIWAQLANRLLTRLRVEAVREPPLLSVGLSSPTPEGRPLGELARTLDEEAELLWAGPEFLNSRLPVETVVAFSRYVGRRPWLYDNYPDNRFAPHKLFLGPYEGRDPALANHLTGVTAVAMQQALASQVPLATVADFLWDPGAYEPEVAWERALREVGGQGADAFRQFAGLNRSSILDHREDEELETALAAWELEGFHGYLARKLMKLEDALGSLGVNENQPVIEEIAPWTKKASYLVQTATHALELSHSLRTTRTDAERLYQQAVLDLSHSRQLPQIVAPFRLDRFAVRVLRQAEVKLGKPLGRIQTTAPQGHEHPRGLAADGDLMTSFRATANLRAGDSITLDMGTVMRVRWVHLSQGYFYYWPEGCVEEGRLLCSVDGETWQELSRINGPGAWEVDLQLSPSKALRYLRLVNDAPRSWPMVVRQLEVYE